MGQVFMGGSGGGGGGSSDDCTATRAMVLEGHTAVTRDSDDEPAAGTMPDNPAQDAVLMAGESKVIPAGYTPGGTVSAKDLASQTAGTAGAADIRKSRTAVVNGALVTGTQEDRGAWNGTVGMNGSVAVPAGIHNGQGAVSGPSVTQRGAWSSSELAAGGSVTIPEGYHNGAGKVAAKSLASQTGGATASDGNVLSGYTYWKDGAKRTGTMANLSGTPNKIQNWRLYNNRFEVAVDSGYHGCYWAGNSYEYMELSEVAATLGLTAAKLAKGQTVCGVAGSYTSDANASAAVIRSGYTAYINGVKVTGTLAVTSAISFSAAALSSSSIRISWTNPAKGPWQGVFIQSSTSGYPGTGGGSRVYTGAGNNPNQGGGWNYVDITGLSPGTTYYFTATSYCDALGWGTSNNINVRTEDRTLQEILSGYGWEGDPPTKNYGRPARPYLSFSKYYSSKWYTINGTGIYEADGGALRYNAAYDTVISGNTVTVNAVAVVPATYGSLGNKYALCFSVCTSVMSNSDMEAIKAFKVRVDTSKLYMAQGTPSDGVYNISAVSCARTVANTTASRYTVYVVLDKPCAAKGNSMTVTFYK